MVKNSSKFVKKISSTKFLKIHQKFVKKNRKIHQNKDYKNYTEIKTFLLMTPILDEGNLHSKKLRSA